MIIFPAIDVRGGKVVRLEKGDPRRQTVFSDDPRATAKEWIEQGASWFHMVNLDGAFDDANDNLRILESVAKLDAKVQFAGGLRDMGSMRRALNAGAARLVVGTLAIREPETFVRAVGIFGGERVGVALDAKGGKIATHGWTEVTSKDPSVFGKWLRERGVMHALYTDVARDGLLSGVDIEGSIALAQETGLQVIASGGVRDLSDIRRLAASGLVAGAVVGMALYRQRFTLVEAISSAKESA